jgi:outer membrane protein assembly factor BamB
MHLVRVLLASSLFALTLSGTAKAFERVRLTEVSASFSSLEPEFGPGTGFALLPRRTSAPFSSARGRLGAQNNALGFVYESLACGPSAAVNTFTCRSLPSARFAADIPVPGFVSSAPLFFEDSWIVGTTKGFLVRFRKQQGVDGFAPQLRSEFLGFWGSESRKVMNSARGSESERLGFQWSYYLGSEVVGSPFVFEKTVFALAANQFLYAIDVTTGQPRWTLRLAPDSTLRLEALSLVPLFGRGELLVGTAEGALMSVSAKTGAVSWRHRLDSVSGERFRTIVAKPLVLDKGVVVSSAEGVTEFLSFGKCSKDDSNCVADDRAVEWKYRLGSVASARFFDSGVALGGSEGSVVLLDPRNGALRWRVSVFGGAAVASMSVVSVSGKDFLVVAAVDGSMVLLDKFGRVVASLFLRNSRIPMFWGFSLSCRRFE